MEQATIAIHTIEHTDSVTVQLHGTIDVFVAADLYVTAKQLVVMGKDVTVTCALTEGFDASAVQILLALQADLRTKGKCLVMTDVSPSVKKWLAYSGVTNNLLNRGERISS